MALPDKIDSIHRNIAMFTGFGSAAALLGMSSYFMAYEYQDFDRLDIGRTERMEDILDKRRRFSIVIMLLSAFIYVAGMVCITLGITLYPTEREEIATNSPGQIQQIQNVAAQPSVNEPAILSGLCSALTLAGMGYGFYNFMKREDFGWVSMSIYSVGWIGNSFAASMNNKSINSLVANRLAWTLPGAALIIAGTAMFPWQLHETYISGPSWPLCALGYVFFSIGTSYLTPAPTQLS